MTEPGGYTVRPATEADAAAMAEIWHAGWREAHLGAVSDELIQYRTEESFGVRALENVSLSSVAEVAGKVAGFVTVWKNEVEQVYLATEHRGGGIATALLREGERLVAVNGHTTAWLAVIGPNTRARRFYARCGWVDDGPFEHLAPGGHIVAAHRYSRTLPDPPS